MTWTLEQVLLFDIFKIENESYDNIEKCLKTLIVKLRNVTQIVINNQTFQIEFLVAEI